MKQHILAMAAIATMANAAQAQSNITIYGQMDVGLTKSSGSTLGIDRGAPNWLGFRGTEDLGNGLQASFRLETRFEPDTGTTESAGRRPLFQGRSWVGVSGALGTVRLGRDYTAMQDLIVDFDPWSFFTVATLLDGALGSYSSDPSYAGSSGNRFSNGVYYSSPLMHGFQAYVTVASKEGLVGGPQLKKNPVSYAASYINGPVYLMVGAERSVNQDKFWNVSGSYRLGQANLMASYSKVDPLIGVNSTNKLIGADIAVGPGQVKLGYGRVTVANAGASQQLSAGYWYSLSKRTLLYTDATHRKPAAGATSNGFDLGIRHSF
ncbi:MAG: porin [Pseudomonadota bacterium]